MSQPTGLGISSTRHVINSAYHVTKTFVSYMWLLSHLLLVTSFTFPWIPNIDNGLIANYALLWGIIGRLKCICSKKSLNSRRHYSNLPLCISPVIPCPKVPEVVFVAFYRSKEDLDDHFRAIRPVAAVLGQHQPGGARVPSPRLFPLTGLSSQRGMSSSRKFGDRPKLPQTERQNGTFDKLFSGISWFFIEII